MFAPLAAMHIGRPRKAVSGLTVHRHPLDEAGDKPLVEKLAIPRVTVSRDALPVSVMREEKAQPVRQILHIPVEDELLIREDVVIAGLAGDECKESVACILGEAVRRIEVMVVRPAEIEPHLRIGDRIEIGAAENGRLLVEPVIGIATGGYFLPQGTHELAPPGGPLLAADGANEIARLILPRETFETFVNRKLGNRTGKRIYFPEQD